MAPAVDQPGMSAHEAAAINAAAVTRNYSVKPRLQYQTVSAVSGSFPTCCQDSSLDRPANHPRQCKGMTHDSLYDVLWSLTMYL